MNTEVKQNKKSVTLADGSKVKKSFTTTLPLFKTEAEVLDFLKDNVAAFAAFGFRAYCKISANNSVSGAGAKDKDLKAALRNFKAAIEVMVEEMDIPRDTAVATMLAKPKFAGVKTYLADLASNEKVHAFDFTETYPVPALGEVEEDEDESDEK